MREYWQYDPTGDYLEPPLQGLELIGGRYHRLPMEEMDDGTLRLASRVLGLDVRIAAGGLRFYDPVTRSYLLPSAAEEKGRLQAEQDLQLEAAAHRQTEARLHREAAARRQTEARLRDEAAARRQAEARVAELEALLRKRGDGSPDKQTKTT